MDSIADMEIDQIVKSGNITKQLFLWAFGSLLNETKIIDLSPPSQVMVCVWVHHLPVLATAGVYSALFLIGVCGNVSMLTILLHLIYHSRKLTAVPVETTFFYIIALSLMDLMVILSLPLTISDMLLGHWIFGSGVCKVHWIMESVGKIMSTLILTLMSFDRYVGVCFPMRSARRSVRCSFAILLLLMGFAMVLLSPLPYYAEAREMASIIPSVQYTFGVWARFITVKCRLIGLTQRVSIAFTWYIFATGFVSPAILIGFFYSQMLWKLRAHKRNAAVGTSIPIGRIVSYTFAICAFYCACWGPYWAGVIYANYSPRALGGARAYSDAAPLEETAELGGREESSHHEFVYLMYVIHALPVINSSFNWIFYAQLNTQLRRKREEIARVLQGGKSSVSRTLAAESTAVYKAGSLFLPPELKSETLKCDTGRMCLTGFTARVDRRRSRTVDFGSLWPEAESRRDARALSVVREAVVEQEEVKKEVVWDMDAEEGSLPQVQVIRGSPSQVELQMRLRSPAPASPERASRATRLRLLEAALSSRASRVDSYSALWTREEIWLPGEHDTFL